MTKKEYHKYLKSKDWTQIKIDLIQIHGMKCQRCGDSRKHPGHLHVHHLTYDRLGKEEVGDLELLCPPCHRKEHLTNNWKKKGFNQSKKKKKSKKKKLTGREKGIQTIRREMMKSRKEQMRLLKYGY